MIKYFGLFLTTLAASAQLNISSPFYVAAVIRPTASSYLIQQGFNVTGYDNPSTEGWSGNNGNGTEDPDSTVSGVVDVPYSLKLVNGNVVEGYWLGGSTNKDTLGVFFGLVVQQTNVNNLIFMVQSNQTQFHFVRVEIGGRLRVFDPVSGDAATVNVMATNTQYYVWSYFDEITGSAGVEFATSLTRTNSGNNFASYTGGQTGRKFNNISFQPSPAGVTNFVDKVRVNPTAIGSNPE